ncbi:hypothetical protein [Schleiferilactobacillus shenzhenensis]|nr:hypothetical protein [Schleiferilactobacillus shenzhenensis]
METPGRNWLPALAQTWHAYERNRQLATHRRLVAEHYRTDMLNLIGRKYRQPFLISAAAALAAAAVLAAIAILGNAPWIWTLVLTLLVAALVISSIGVYRSKQVNLLRQPRYRRTIHRLKHTSHFTRLAKTDWAIRTEQAGLFTQPVVAATLAALPAALHTQEAVSGLYVLIWRQQAATLDQAISLYQRAPHQVGMTPYAVRQLMYQTKQS